jgi:putative chitinase
MICKEDIMSTLTKELLLQIVPQARATTLSLDKVVEELNATFTNQIHGVDFSTKNRQAAFLSQIAVESWYFKELEENLHYSAQGLLATFPHHFDQTNVAQYANQPQKIANRAYANILGNGDEASGEGYKFRGRGMIQLTGKYNYQKCGEFLSMDLVTTPDLLCSVPGAVEAAVWFWNFRNCNKWADLNNIIEVTKLINGGLGSIRERESIYEQGKLLL